MEFSSRVRKVLPAALRAGQGCAGPASPRLGIPLPAQTAPRCIWRGRRGGRWAGPPVVVAGHGDAVHRAPCVVVALQCVAVKHKEAHVTRQIHTCPSTAALLLPLGRQSWGPPPVPCPGRGGSGGESGEKMWLLPSSRSSRCDLLHVCCSFSFAEVGIKEVKKAAVGHRVEARGVPRTGEAPAAQDPRMPKNRPRGSWRAGVASDH